MDKGLNTDEVMQLQPGAKVLYRERSLRFVATIVHRDLSRSPEGESWLSFRVRNDSTGKEFTCGVNPISHGWNYCPWHMFHGPRKAVELSVELGKAEPLLVPERLWSRSEVLARPSPIPASPGVYAWYFADIPPEVPVDDCVSAHDRTLLYVGISPSADLKDAKAPTRQNLNTRVRYHFRGNAEGSTFRLTLGCLLWETLGIRLQRVGSGKRLTFGVDGERALSNWMEQNVFVTWIECERPWEVEHELIQCVSLPLNLDQNRHHPFHLALSAIRSEARAQARAESVFRR